MTTPKKTRVAVVGAGDFGRNHVRVYKELDNAHLVGLVDANPARAQAVAAEFGTQVLPGVEALAGHVDAVSLAVPTIEHARLGCRLLEQGMDVLVEKPMAASLGEADDLIRAAEKHRRVLQVGHLERFNPAVVAAQAVVRDPLFFEVHRLGVFSPRSLDIDVIYDVMIHDLDILLALVNPAPSVRPLGILDLKAVGIPVVTDKVDIAHARIEFESGAVANVTASRVSNKKLRRIRIFGAEHYYGLDYIDQKLEMVRSEPDPQGGWASGAVTLTLSATDASSAAAPVTT